MRIASGPIRALRDELRSRARKMRTNRPVCDFKETASLDCTFFLKILPFQEKNGDVTLNLQSEITGGF